MLGADTMLFGTVATLFLCVGLCELYAKIKARHLPPGVSGFAALWEIPREKPWLRFLQYSQKYGDIASGSVCGHSVIVIGSAKIAEDLLEKRGINYVDRPHSVMGGELSGWGKMLLLCDYNDWFRTQRKWIAQDIGSHASVAKSHGTIEAETRRFLRMVLGNPEEIRLHLRQSFSSVALRLSHGYITKDEHDPLVELAELANSQLSKAVVAGGHPVDLVPLLKYIPSWFPGGSFKKRAAKNAIVLQEALEMPHNYVLSQLAAGTAMPSLSSRLLNLPDLTEEQQENIKWTTFTMFRGGVETSTSISYAFILAMTLYPRVLKKAQEEIHSVVGTGRLPTFDDRPRLPYMEALFTELLRWHTPGPVSMRRTAANDEYNGYLIPAGSYVMVNIWAMLRDERTYTDPLEFKPERFLGDNPEPLPFNACFGFGRRRCPGNHFAHSTLWLLCAQILAAFDISKHVENGVEVPPRFEHVGATFMHVAPFKCSITPRSEAAVGLIMGEFSVNGSASKN